jgi:lipoprotein signal peptidase
MIGNNPHRKILAFVALVVSISSILIDFFVRVFFKIGDSFLFLAYEVNNENQILNVLGIHYFNHGFGRILVLLLFIVSTYILRDLIENEIENIAVGLSLGGSLSNAFLSLIFGAVVDYIKIGKIVMNIADVSIYTGSILIMIQIILHERRKRQSNR